MKILAQLTPKPGRSPADFQPYLVAEEKAVWGAYREGWLREMYLQPEPLTVSLVFELPSTAELEARLQAFPIVAAGLLDVRLVGLGPWLPLEALFDPAHVTATHP